MRYAPHAPPIRYVGYALYSVCQGVRVRPRAIRYAGARAYRPIRYVGYARHPTRAARPGGRLAGSRLVKSGQRIKAASGNRPNGFGRLPCARSRVSGFLHYRACAPYVRALVAMSSGHWLASGGAGAWLACGHKKTRHCGGLVLVLGVLVSWAGAGPCCAVAELLRLCSLAWPGLCASPQPWPVWPPGFPCQSTGAI